MLVYSSAGFLVHVWCKTNNNIPLFYPFVQDTNDSFVPCFAFVLCIMTSTVPFYMDHKPYSYWLRVKIESPSYRIKSCNWLLGRRKVDISSIASFKLFLIAWLREYCTFSDSSVVSLKSST